MVSNLRHPDYYQEIFGGTSRGRTINSAPQQHENILKEVFNDLTLDQTQFFTEIWDVYELWIWNDQIDAITVDQIYFIP